MSKAFTRESDDGPEPPATPRPASPLPTGAKNYLTPGGARRLHEELNRLVQLERPEAAARGQTQALDQRIQYLQQSLRSAVVVKQPAKPEDCIRFGATVTVREGGGESTYRIVGVDETDIDHGWVSWLSPIAKALLNHKRGERVRFRFPSGEKELEIVKVDYE